ELKHVRSLLQQTNTAPLTRVQSPGHRVVLQVASRGCQDGEIIGPFVLNWSALVPVKLLGGCFKSVSEDYNQSADAGEVSANSLPCSHIVGATLACLGYPNPGGLADGRLDDAAHGYADASEHGDDDDVEVDVTFHLGDHFVVKLLEDDA
ncbi:hypothetical protein CSPAE12_07331, partial [Colletotrichum incanum]